jgi:uncharacterized membrane protein HdeD (DUF308 family)
METVRVVLVVGLLLVLPQVMGFVASRLGRRRYAGLWPLAAAGTVAVYWALFAFYDYREGQRAIATGELRCGTGAMAMHYLASLLLGAHGALGSFLSMLDRRGQRLSGPGA